jgi:hypothetical protein
LVRVQPLDRLHHHGGVHDGAIDDGLGRQALGPEFDERVTSALLFLQLDELDGRGADIEADYIFAL